MTAPPSPIKPRHFLYLDGMRGVAAIFVSILHCGQILKIKAIYVPNAHLAVDFFFCLSGFVIAYAYGDKLNITMTKSEFLIRRLVRLGPVLLIGLLLGSALFIFGAVHKSNHDLNVALIISLLSIFMIPAGIFLGRQAYPTNNPVWSLFFEIFSNIVYAFTTIKSINKTIFLLALFSITLIATGFYFKDIYSIGFASPIKFIGGFARVGYPFLAGIIIYKLHLYQNRRQIWSIGAFITLPILLTLPLDNWKSDVIIIIAVIPAIVISGTAQASISIAPCLRFLGEISYPFYLVHQPIFRALGHAEIIQHLSSTHPFVVITLSVGAAIACALAVSKFLDVPVRRYLTNRFVYPASNRSDEPKGETIRLSA